MSPARCKYGPPRLYMGRPKDLPDRIADLERSVRRLSSELADALASIDSVQRYAESSVNRLQDAINGIGPPARNYELTAKAAQERERKRQRSLSMEAEAVRDRIRKRKARARERQ